jgi:hypothetical protein
MPSSISHGTLYMELSDSTKKYAGSGRFVHDMLLARCPALFETAKRVWREKHADPSIIILWPSEPVEGADGQMIEDEILADFNVSWREDHQLRSERLRRLVGMTKACGLLVIELRPDALVAIFETPHGAHSWTSRRERRGDVVVLAATEESTNKEHLGLFWSPSQGTA